MVKVSVIMGVYNISNSVEQFQIAVNSILNQSFTNYEIIICEDGSTDDTYDIINKLYLKNPKIKILKNKSNLGLAASLNNCIQNSCSEYVARMDADDYSMEYRLEKQVAFLDENPDISFVGCNIGLFKDENIWGERKSPEYPEKKDFLFKAPFTHPTIMYRRTTLEKVNNYRACKETLRCEDYDIYMRIYQLGMKGANIQEVLFCFREDENAFKRRKYKFRFDEAKVRYKGFKGLGMMPWAIVYVIKPLIVGLIPQVLLTKLKSEKRRD